MKPMDNLVQQLLNLEFFYEKKETLTSLGVTYQPTGYVYFRAEDIMPVLKAMEKEHDRLSK